jgi:hypothetical protein
MFSRDSLWFKALTRRFRTRRFRYVESMIRALLEERDEISVLDVGGRLAYWEMLPTDLRSKVHVTVLNFAAELADDGSLDTDLRISASEGDACAMPQYADRSFDLVHSNSVIEHVGSYQNMIRFADEVRRVGRAYYVQTPNYWFPIDPHYAVPFVHWLPDPLRARLFSTMNVGLASKVDYKFALVRIDDCRIVSRPLIRTLFPDGRHSAERFLLAWVKSLIVSRPAREIETTASR